MMDAPTPTHQHNFPHHGPNAMCKCGVRQYDYLFNLRAPAPAVSGQTPTGLRELLAALVVQLRADAEGMTDFTQQWHGEESKIYGSAKASGYRYIATKLETILASSAPVASAPKDETTNDQSRVVDVPSDRLMESTAASIEPIRAGRLTRYDLQPCEGEGRQCFARMVVAEDGDYYLVADVDAS